MPWVTKHAKSVKYQSSFSSKTILRSNNKVVLRATSCNNGVQADRSVSFIMDADGDYVIPFSAFPTVDFSKIIRIVVAISSEINAEWSLDGICTRPLTGGNLRSAAIRPSITPVQNEVLFPEMIDVKLYPVPANFTLYARPNTSDALNINYHVMDATGRTVLTSIWNTLQQPELTLDLAELKNGIYLFGYQLEGKMVTKKFTITR